MKEGRKVIYHVGTHSPPKEGKGREGKEGREGRTFKEGRKEGRKGV